MEKLFALIWIYLCIEGSVFSIVPYNQAMHPEFTENKYPQAKSWLAKESYEINNYEVATFSEQPIIPKIIHQIWIGGELPEKFKQFVKTWKEKHPDWTYVFWTDKDISSFEFLNKEQFDLAVNKGTKSDIWRYEILYKYGGVYLDIDYECIRPLDILHHTCKFYACAGQDCICNGVIGCTPGHPIIKSCIQGIKLLRGDNLQYPWFYTGPGLMTKCVNNYLWKKRYAGMDKVAIYPALFFHPFDNNYRFEYWSGKLSRQDIDSYLIPETFAVHFWALSWNE